ncbi:MAG: TIGR04211 family SH3 domain-containing protein [Desulfatitalea sp.]|nr:TIGR04211 family SH3 domain-containing protein [Desulfatitalea sp.]
MKRLLQTALLAGLCLVYSLGTGMAATRYISEEFEVPMRSGQSTEHRIISLVPTGRNVELVTPGDEWSMVRLSNGREGWVLTRYLTDKMPSAMQLERLERRHAEVMSQNSALQERASELTAENRGLTETLAQTQQQLETIETAHEALKQESAEFLSLKSEFEQIQNALAEARTRSDEFESALNQVTNSQLYQGLLYGGGLVIVGFIAGFILKKPKRRSPLM